MRNRLRISPSMVVAIAAVVLAAAGTAAATRVLVKRDTRTVTVVRSGDRARAAKKSRRGPRGFPGPAGRQVSVG
jgi:hypothetical protein